ncbi:hypothetical protein KAR91_57955 [Candidatus Pacearchaeota archaeon]|nr:hypothetical protein [Candidatus Pacearchaeota archaeon]
MKNPCNECLVKPACSKICDEKDTYREYIVKRLIAVCKHIYEENGNKRKHIPTSAILQQQKWIHLCEEDSKDNDKIMGRYYK